MASQAGTTLQDSTRRQGVQGARGAGEEVRADLQGTNEAKPPLQGGQEPRGTGTPAGAGVAYSGTEDSYPDTVGSYTYYKLLH